MKRIAAVMQVMPVVAILLASCTLQDQSARSSSSQEISPRMAEAIENYHLAEMREIARLSTVEDDPVLIARSTIQNLAEERAALLQVASEEGLGRAHQVGFRQITTDVDRVVASVLDYRATSLEMLEEEAAEAASQEQVPDASESAAD